ncbi:MAG: hypothetical protein RLZZ192_483 [Pseudomonadota bacterium]
MVMNAMIPGSTCPFAHDKILTDLRATVRGDFVLTADLLPLLLPIGCRA